MHYGWLYRALLATRARLLVLTTQECSHLLPDTAQRDTTAHLLAVSLETSQYTGQERDTQSISESWVSHGDGTLLTKVIANFFLQRFPPLWNLTASLRGH